MVLIVALIVAVIAIFCLAAFFRSPARNAGRSRGGHGGGWSTPFFGGGDSSDSGHDCGDGGGGSSCGGGSGCGGGSSS